MEARVQGGREAGASPPPSFALVGLTACSSGSEGSEAGGAVAFCGGGAEPPVAPLREEQRGGIFPWGGFHELSI
jgi:hypothetical protein